MSAMDKLFAGVVKATGDESIIAVTELRPKGSMAAGMAGAAAGSAAGGDSAMASGFGVGAGSYAAEGAAAAARGLPKYIAVGISPKKVYVLGLPEGAWTVRYDDVYPIAEIDRDRLGVEVHQRATVRTVILEDLDSGKRLEMEAPRLNRYHAGAFLELLMASEQHQDADDEPED